MTENPSRQTHPADDGRTYWYVCRRLCPAQTWLADQSRLPPDQYIATHLSLSAADADQLHQKYYQQYGLAIEGLVRHHKIDPIEYNRKVDDALPLASVLSPDPQLRKLLLDIDRSKIRLWLFTNAYVNHARRVLKLLAVDDLFEGLTYCDYGAERIICKPHKDMYDKAQREAGVSSPEKCYFVGEPLPVVR